VIAVVEYVIMSLGVFDHNQISKLRGIVASVPLNKWKQHLIQIYETERMVNEMIWVFVSKLM
jgi:hypothetical protein